MYSMCAFYTCNILVTQCKVRNDLIHSSDMFFNSNEKENQKCKENNSYTNFSSSAKRNCKCAHLDNIT